MHQDYQLIFLSVSTSACSKLFSYSRKGLVSRGLTRLQGKVGLLPGRFCHLVSFMLFKQDWIYSVLIEIYFLSFMEEFLFLLVALNNCALGSRESSSSSSSSNNSNRHSITMP